MTKNKLPTENTIRRSCFICGSTQGPVFLDRTMDVLGVGRQRMAYRACEGCGLVLQDPAVPHDTMLTYYQNYSNYTNAGRDGAPSERKTFIVEDQLKYVAGKKTVPGKAFQVGCSDGYTLSRFKAGGWQVFGCDPSASAIDIGRKQWRVEARPGDFESYVPDTGETYDLFILTHVLEHIYDPVEALRKAASMLNDDGIILVEVPLLTDPEHLIEGYFTFEHINYFSHASLTNLLQISGFSLITEIEDDYETDQYPVQRLLAQKSDRKKKPLLNDFKWSQKVLADFEVWERNQWQARLDKALARKDPEQSIVIWAGGLHTSQLFYYTEIAEQTAIEAIVDNDSQKWGKCVHGVTVISPDTYWKSHQDTPILISSRASEQEIASSLREKGVEDGKILTLYDPDPV
ncbi:class I SAM-dependent methyltransferase [Kordiimonas lacus]|uniref:Methyltransferase domain-containing protein n=1 Tax=Kordiimonas lacus TaxID=637679 RepID=A0A1G6VXV2_9PROT|nr:class I SAM-dependent methyltransferase [Kordiimonas lacus]SDD58399.1 Methyltransferase domain-containing protein [Kordiimonas lacus]